MNKISAEFSKANDEHIEAIVKFKKLLRILYQSCLKFEVFQMKEDTGTLTSLGENGVDTSQINEL